MNFSFVDPWHAFLPREGGHVVGICGSGGKTSLLRAIAAQYRAEGRPVVLTTTTRTEPLDGLPVADLEDEAAMAALADVPAFFVRAGTDAEGKWRGLSAAGVDALGGRWPDRIVLAEVDGSAKRPLKWYRPGEPVWPGRTSLAIVVMGLQALDERASEVVHRFGRAEFAPLAHLEPQSRWTWEHLLVLLTGDGGYLDRVPRGLPTVLALGGLDQLHDSIGLFEFMGRAMADERLPLALFYQPGDGEPSLRTVCRREDREPADG